MKRDQPNQTRPCFRTWQPIHTCS